MIAQRTLDVLIILMIHIRVSVWMDLKIINLFEEGIAGVSI